VEEYGSDLFNLKNPRFDLKHLCKKSENLE